MRSYLSISLLLVLLLPAGISQLYYGYRFQQIKKEIKRQLKQGVPDNELVLLGIPAELEKEPNTHFQRIHAREFKYLGQMYDIVRQESCDDTTWYWCIHDFKESALFAELDGLAGQLREGDLPSRESRSRLVRYFQTLFFTELPRVGATPPEADADNPMALYLFELQDGYTSTPAPPPKPV